MFDNPSFDHHEGVHFFSDPDSGLRAVIAIHSTALGPSAGGTRMWNYAKSEEMLTDALRLSQGMSYKNAMASIPHGGGKAVIWGNSKTDKSEALFLAFGRAVESLQGRYWTAEDVGIDTADIDITARTTCSEVDFSDFNIDVSRIDAEICGGPVTCFQALYPTTEHEIEPFRLIGF